MVTQKTNQEGHGSAEAEHVQNCDSAPKWAALIDDRLFPMSRRRLMARDILDQAGIGLNFVLIRDHETRNDVPFAADTAVDLAGGNVFRSAARCEPGPNPHCPGAAKLAFVCDDEWEVTLIDTQTGRSLKRLLGLPDEAVLLRDFESPNDHPIGDDEAVAFRDGAVFTCSNRPAFRETKIFVNGREKVVSGKTISYAELVVLAFGAVDPNTIYTITFKYGPPSKPEGKMAQGDVVKIQCEMHFNVTPTCKS
jgi:hypothetical protein